MLLYNKEMLRDSSHEKVHLCEPRSAVSFAHHLQKAPESKKLMVSYPSRSHFEEQLSLCFFLIYF